MEKLQDNQITEELKSLSHWSRKGNSIVRTFNTGGFPQTMGLTAAIGAICQAHDHHPDYLTIKYASVEVSFSTHSAGGITAKDIKIATEIEKLKIGAESN